MTVVLSPTTIRTFTIPNNAFNVSMFIQGPGGGGGSVLQVAQDQQEEPEVVVRVEVRKSTLMLETQSASLGEMGNFK